MPSCWRKIVIAVFCEICLSCSMIGETVFLRPCEAPLINGMTGKWNTTGTQETREIGKNAGGCSAWIFSRNKEEDDDKAKVGKRSRFLAHLTIINAWLAFSLDEPKPNHHSMEHAHAQKNSRPTIWYHTTTKNYLGSQKYFSSYFGYETKNSPQK